ncbi:MAG: hypothetical protein HRU09_21045 [Oligoflexales bacterium]|nr:hypothetical protein [Oligoflexales bacterium]
MKYSIIFFLFLLANTAKSSNLFDIVPHLVPQSINHKALLNSKKVEWSEPFVLYRAFAHEPAEHTSIENSNLGNYEAQLKYLSMANAAKNYHYIKAFKVKVNYHKASEYFHCEQGKCEYRFNCGDTTPVQVAGKKFSKKYNEEKFERFGIKVGTSTFQISVGGTNAVDFYDVYMRPKDAKEKVYRCDAVDGVDCFFAFSAEDRHTYEVLDETDTIPFDMSMDVKETLDSLHDTLMN